MSSAGEDDTADDPQRFLSRESQVSRHVTFRNDCSRTCSVFWLDFSGREVFYKRLKPGEQYRQQTYLSHPWVAHADPSTEFLLLNQKRVFLPTRNEGMVLITDSEDTSRGPSPHS
eukprot:TRINITY_DN7672_c0_g1_i1.p1 TRINITY_DN7672_c0_g1~~TRINITY_DN7672_c0_g1_i1.p1  ORF type:complete len:123 (-),score=15.14 TRINITY_DN7672_c0_g1_i1:89-433(-)